MNLKKLASLSVMCISLISCNKAKESEVTVADTANNEELIQTLYDFEQQALSADIKLEYALANIVKDKSERLKINFDSQKHAFSQIAFKPNQAWDWSEYRNFNLAFDISNPGEHSVQLYLDISDIDGANYTRTISIPVGGEQTYYAIMDSEALNTPDEKNSNELNFKSGLRSDPPTWDSDDKLFVSMWGKKNLNTAGIKSIALSVQSALFDKEITIDNVRLRKNPELNPLYLSQIVDKYGQSSKLEFNGKIFAVINNEQVHINTH